jgi:hypothetical protein
VAPGGVWQLRKTRTESPLRHRFEAAGLTEMEEHRPSIHETAHQ